MKYYGAYTNKTVYAIGETPDEAIRNAMIGTCKPAAVFKTAKVSAKLAAEIERDGWKGKLESFKIHCCYIVDTTG